MHLVHYFSHLTAVNLVALEAAETKIFRRQCFPPAVEWGPDIQGYIRLGGFIQGGSGKTENGGLPL